MRPRLLVNAAWKAAAVLRHCNLFLDFLVCTCIFDNTKFCKIMAPTRGKRKAKQTDASSTSRRAQRARRQRTKAQVRADKVEKIKEHNTTRFSNRPGRAREKVECGIVHLHPRACLRVKTDRKLLDSDAQSALLALEKTLHVLDFGDTQVNLFNRQLRGNQLPDLPSLRFAPQTRAISDDDDENLVIKGFD